MSKVKNPDGTITIDGVTYDPKTQFLKKRRDGWHVFDKAIRRWQRFGKFKGELKDSVNHNNRPYERKKMLKNMGYSK